MTNLVANLLLIALHISKFSYCRFLCRKLQYCLHFHSLLTIISVPSFSSPFNRTLSLLFHSLTPPHSLTVLSFTLFQLSTLEHRVVEAETRADEAEEKVREGVKESEGGRVKVSESE